MGLADALFAGVGTGLAQGAQNFVQEQDRQRRMQMEQQQRDQQAQLFEMQKQQHAFDQGSKMLALQQHEGRSAYGAGNYGAVEGMQDGINASRRQMGLAPLPVIHGTVTPAQPAQTLPQYGPMWSGAALPDKQIAATPERVDYSPEQRMGLAAAVDWTRPKTEYLSMSPGATRVPIDPRTGQPDMAHAITAPERQKPYSLGPGQVRYDAAGNVIARGPQRPTPAGPGMQHVQVPQVDGTVKYYVFDPRSGSYTESPAVIGGKPPAGRARPDPHWAGYSAVKPYEELIRNAASTFGVPENRLRAMIYHESGGNPNARGAAGEYGLMQLMPETVASLGLKNPLDPAENIFGGAKWLAMKIKQQGGDVDRGTIAYNGSGPAARKYGATIADLASRWDNRSEVTPRAAALRPSYNDPANPNAATMTEVKPGEVINARPRAAGPVRAAKPFDYKKADADIRAELQIRAGRTVPEARKAEYDAAMTRRKAEYAASQRAPGEKSKLQQLLEMP